MLNLPPYLPACCALALSAVSLTAAAGDKDRINFLEGPATARLGNAAELRVPAGFIFIDGKTVRKLKQANGDPVSGRELGELEPTNGNWAVQFNFDEDGYVKDDEKDKLDADASLQQIKEGTEAANRVREKSGNPPVHVIGWEVPPKYNENTHNLEWAVKGECQGIEILNYDTRLLGRKGVMRVKLILEPEKFTEILPAFNKVMAGYKFSAGETYAEYRPGDKIAKYGLAALVVGGAGVAAAKLGLLGPLILILKKFWFLVIAALVAVLNFFKRGIGALFGRPDKK